MSTLIKSEGPCLITPDCTSHDPSVVRGDPGGNIHSHHIAAVQVSAAVDHGHAFGSFPCKFPGQSRSEQTVNDHVGDLCAAVCGILLPGRKSAGTTPGELFHLRAVVIQDPLLDSKTALRRYLSGESAEADIIAAVQQDPAGCEGIRTVIAASGGSQDHRASAAAYTGKIFAQKNVNAVRNGQRCTFHQDQRRDPDHFGRSGITRCHLRARQYIFHLHNLDRKLPDAGESCSVRSSADHSFSEVIEFL